LRNHYFVTVDMKSKQIN